MRLLPFNFLIIYAMWSWEYCNISNPSTSHRCSASQRTHDAKITPLWRQNEVVSTSHLRYYCVACPFGRLTWQGLISFFMWMTGPYKSTRLACRNDCCVSFGYIHNENYTGGQNNGAAQGNVNHDVNMGLWDHAFVAVSCRNDKNGAQLANTSGN